MNCVKFGVSKVHFLFTWVMLLSKDLLVCMYVYGTKYYVFWL